MTGKFIANLAFLILVNFLVKPAALLVDASVQNAVGAETYGMFSIVFNFSTLFYILLDFGITSYNNRSVAQNPAFVSNLPRILSLKLLLAVAYVALTYTTAFILGYPPAQMYLLLFMMAAQILLSMLLYFRSNISGLQLFKIDSVLSVLDKLLLLVIVALLLWGGLTASRFNIHWYAYAQVASLGLTAAFALALVLMVYRRNKTSFKWSLEDTKHLLKDTYPYALLGILMTMYYRIDTVMIGQLLPENIAYHEAGAYAASFRFLDAANNVALLFTVILLPMFARMLTTGEKVDELVKFSFKLLFSGSVIVMGIAFFFRQEIVHLIYHEATPYWGEIFGMLFLAFGAVCSVYIYGTLLTANGSIRVLNYIALGGAGLNILLNFILIPKYHALGSAIATLITQWIVATAHVWVARKVLKLENDSDIAWRIALMIGGTIALGLGATCLPTDWKLNMALLSIFSFALAFVLRLIDLKEMLRLLKNRA